MDAFTWAKSIESLDGLVRPSSHTSRVEWNKRWEDDLARAYDEKILIDTGLRHTQHSREMQELTKEATQMMLLAVEGRKEDVIGVQGQVISRAVNKLLNNDLEELWKNITTDRRNEIVLEAIYRASCLPGGWEEARKWCPDITISSLCANEGKLFIDWVRRIIASRRLPPGSDLRPFKIQPVIFQHPLLDKILEAMDLEVFRRVILLSRSYYISFVLWYILLAIYNDADYEHSGVSKSAKQVGTLEFAYKAAEKLHGENTAKSVKKKWKEYLADAQAVNTCFYCKKGPSTEEPLKACVKCNEIGRIIRYCSRECQTLDWKKGHVRPHKQICGKPFQLDPSFGVEPRPLPDEVPARVPKPDPGFQRSLALEWQLNFVHSTGADYTLVATEDNADHVPIYFPSPLTEDTEHSYEIVPRMTFLIMRNKALVNGDSNAVNAMFELCKPILEEKGIPAERLAVQLEKEFGVKVDEEFELTNIPRWTVEEAYWALKLIAIFESLDEVRAGYFSS